jgi:hypothetical protein
MTDDEVISEIEARRGLMTALATGGPRIQEVNNQYTQRRFRIAVERSRPRDLYDIVHVLENARG